MSLCCNGYLATRWIFILTCTNAHVSTAENTTPARTMDLVQPGRVLRIVPQSGNYSPRESEPSVSWKSARGWSIRQRLAEVGGPESHVDTIEIDPVHADLAEAEIGKRGLSPRVRILRGDARDTLQTLDEQYDVVFSDGGQNGVSHELRRLTRPEGSRCGDQVSIA